jgi:hypothetical protein
MPTLQKGTEKIRTSMALFALLLPTITAAFTNPSAFRPGRLALYSSSEPPLVEAVIVDPVSLRLEKELFKIADSTNRGFTASPSQRKRARELIFDLAAFNPTSQPAAPYYNTTTIAADNDGSPTVAGKWTLVYTDAPDITALDSGGPFATAKLGRIGQECEPPLIKNVIEWKRPDWAASLPFSGTEQSRVLQKVCVQATASPDKPLIVNLELVGIEVVSGSTSSGNATTFGEAVQENGLPAAWFQSNPLELRGPLTAPFGQFEVLYLDDRMRIIKTGQNYLAVNIRNEEDWF